MVSRERARRFYPAYSHAEILSQHPRFKWCAVVDPSAEARALAGSAWKIALAEAGTDAVARQIQPKVAVLAGPPQHRLAALDSFSELRAVLVEKPLGRNLAETRQFLSACERRGIAVQVNLFRRADPRFLELASGRLEQLIGIPQAVTAVYGNGLRNTGCHIIDLFRMFFGPVVSARCLGSPKADPRLPLDGDAAVNFALIHGSGLLTTGLHIDFRYYRENAVDIWGTKGRLAIRQEMTDFRHFALAESRLIEGCNEVKSDDLGTRIFDPVSMGYRLIYDNLAAYLDNGEPLLSSGLSALETERVLEAILSSGASGCREFPVGEES